MSGIGGEPEHRQRVRLYLTVGELETVELAKASLTTEFGRVPTLSEAIVLLCRRRNDAVRGAASVRSLRPIPVPSTG